VTGFGVVERVDGRVVHVAHGTLRHAADASLARRLDRLYRALCDVIEAHGPDVASVEQVFVARSARSALVLGQARGVALAALLAAPALQAQTTTMPSTLRYGSGLMDIPVASVLPHLAITGTYSGFFVNLERNLQVDASGQPVGFGQVEEVRRGKPSLEEVFMTLMEEER